VESEREKQPDSQTLNIDETAMLSSGDEAYYARLERARLPGDEFGRYRIQKTLGEGTMGSVYLAHDKQLDRKVALKIPKVNAKEDSRFIERFLREARAAATLTHPNICPVYDVGEIDGTHFITMAYIQGHTLAEFITPEKAQPDRHVANVVRKIALALHEAHVNGMVHRDVKPGNIMIDQRTEPIIMDFGLARQIDDSGDARLTRDGAILGSPAYMSPEQIEGKSATIGPACDIYSLGVILYELLTGNLPFQGSVASIIGQIISKEAPSPTTYRPDISPRLAEICTKAIAKKIDERYKSMKDFASSLAEFIKANPQDDASAAAAAQKKQAAEASPPSDKIDVICQCGQRMIANRDMAGKMVKCPRCATAVPIPGPKQIDVTCQHCTQRFMARDELAGKVVKCPMCTRPLTVPKPGGAQTIAPQIEASCVCGQQFVATPQLAGKSVSCTACGQHLIIPSA
jgi:predicted Ser/Thr protein kinase